MDVKSAFVWAQSKLCWFDRWRAIGSPADFAPPPSAPARRRGNLASARPRGFTLIELLVVLAIVATLLSLVAPRYLHRIDTAKEDVLRENLDRTRRVIDQFRADTGRYPEALDELVTRRYLRDVPLDPLTERRDSWVIDPPPAPEQGQVYDLHSGAGGSGSDGRPYREW